MVDWAMLQDCGKSSVKSVLVCLAYRHNKATGLCCPSIPCISQDTHLERKTILGAIAKLEKLGLISVDRGNGRSSSYELKPVPKTAQVSEGKPIPKTELLASTKNGTGPESGTSTKNGTEPVPKTAPGSAKNGTRNKELTRKEQGTNKYIVKKSQTWKDFFAEYPPNKKGGTDQTPWNKAKSLKLTEQDFILMLEDIRKRRELCPSWYDTYAYGVTRYITEKFWLTPITPEIQSRQRGHDHEPDYNPTARPLSFEEIDRINGRSANESGHDLEGVYSVVR